MLCVEYSLSFFWGEAVEVEDAGVYLFICLADLLFQRVAGWVVVVEVWFPFVLLREGEAYLLFLQFSEEACEVQLVEGLQGSWWYATGTRASRPRLMAGCYSAGGTPAYHRPRLTAGGYPAGETPAYHLSRPRLLADCYPAGGTPAYHLRPRAIAPVLIPALLLLDCSEYILPYCQNVQHP